MSARFATTIHLSMEELARHGGGTGPHRDGWGVAYLDGGDAQIIREPEAASDSRLLGFLQQLDPRSDVVIAHIRRATQGPRLLRNTQPFAREIGGRTHVFAHNGMLPGIEDDPRFAPGRFRRIGDTDSEHAFCALAGRIARLWDDGVPALDDRLDVVGEFAAELCGIGPANFLYSDGDAVFAHGHRRRDDGGEIRPPGLHWLCRRCAPDADGVPLAGITIGHGADQEVALVASVPLSDEPWTPLAEGEVVVLREGQVVRRA